MFEAVVVMERIFISLGSNLGARQKNLAEAIELLKRKCSIVKVSSIYETQPVDFADQPWFLNQVVEAQTDLEPGKLLLFMQSIENGMGRVKTIRFGPRVIDLDLVFYGSRVINEPPELIVPHQRCHQRRFVLQPIVEIDPDFVHPVMKRTVKWLLSRLPKAEDSVRLYKKVK